MDGRYIGILLPVSISTTCNHRHVILHLYTTFRHNRTISGGVMTSYRFFKMAVIESEIYFRVQTSWLESFKKMEIYLHTKFRRDISIHSWVITTPGFGKRTSAILELYFRFQFRPIHHHRHGKLPQRTKFCPNRPTHGGFMTSYRFFKMAVIASQIYFRLLDHPRSCVDGLKKRRKFCVNRLTSFWDMWIHHFHRLCLKMPIPVHFGEAFGGMTP